MTSTTTPTTAQQTHHSTPAHLTSKDHTMSPDPSHLIRTILTAAATFLGLLLLVALWTVYGPTYDAQAAPTSPTTSEAAEPCPAGEATGGTCGTEGQVAGPAAPSTSPSDSSQTDSPTTPAPQRRCKGCRLTQEEYDARQADKQAAHDRAEARKQRGAERREEAQRKREERATRKSSKTSTSPKSSRSHTSKASESSSNGSNAQDGTSTPADTSSAAEDAPETLSDAPTSDDTTSSDTDAPAASAPYAPLEIPEASHKPAPYDASKDPFEVRREAARQAADAVNHSSDQVKAPSTTPAPTAAAPHSGYWAEQLPTWALGLIGFLAASGLIVYKASRPRGDRRS